MLHCLPLMRYMYVQCIFNVSTYYIMQSRKNLASYPGPSQKGKILSLSGITAHKYVDILEVLISCRIPYPYGVVLLTVFQVLEFSVGSAQLYLTVLTISMWDHRKIAKDVFLGKLNPSSQ